MKMAEITNLIGVGVIGQRYLQQWTIKMISYKSFRKQVPPKYIKSFDVVNTIVKIDRIQSYKGDCPGRLQKQHKKRRV